MRSASSYINKYQNKKNLEDNYHKALDDKDFKSFVSQLDISDDIKMKYTSMLQEVVIENKIKTKCSENNYCNHPVKGYVYSVRIVNNDLEFFYERCLYDKRNDNLLLYDLPESLSRASFADIYLNDKKRAEVIKYLGEYLKNYQNKPKGLYLSGSFGSGKTYLICALFNELGRKGLRSIVAHFPELIRSLKDFDDFHIKFNQLKKVPFLLLDDIGAEYLTPWARDEVLEPLIDYRMNNNLATFFTSNYTLTELEEHLMLKGTTDDKINAKRILERIKMLTNEKTLISKNLRGNNG